MIRIRAKVNVLKIVKDWMFKGKAGTYLDLTLLENKDGQQSQYGDDGIVIQDAPKAVRDQGGKGNIVGNWRHLEAKPQPKPAAPNTLPHKCVPNDHDQPAEDDVPF